MDELLTSIAMRKMQLEELRPLSAKTLANLEHYYDIELTYTSNAIEGNTLSPVETTLVIEQGVTIGGKPLKDHLEALDHYDAIRWVRDLAKHGTPLTESDVRSLHFTGGEAIAAGDRGVVHRSGAICADRNGPARVSGCSRSSSTDGRLCRVAAECTGHG